MPKSTCFNVATIFLSTLFCPAVIFSFMNLLIMSLFTEMLPLTATLNQQMISHSTFITAISEFFKLSKPAGLGTKSCPKCGDFPEHLIFDGTGVKNMRIKGMFQFSSPTPFCRLLCAELTIYLCHYQQGSRTG